MEFDLVGAMYEAPRKPKFENDFIMLSEFSELVGPVPVCFVPEEKAKGNFNASHFSVRIMSSDFQTASGKLVSQDTQVILSEKQDCAYAYVHYFSLNDNNARGYVRQYALSYISSSSSKIVDNFEELLKQFSEVTAMLKVSNHLLFQRDLSRYLADLNLTMNLLQEEGYTESVADPSQLYSEFDFAKQDVPERDPGQVAQDMSETKEILASIKHEMSKEETLCVLEDLRRTRKIRKQQRSRDRAHSYPLEMQMKGGGASGGFTSYLPVSPDLGTKTSLDSLSLSVSSSGSSDYEPKRVMTHLVHKFERRLRTLEELSPQAHSVAMERLQEIHRFFSRSEMALELEREEIALIAPQSSLLTIGRVPVLNFLQDYSPQPQAPPPLYDPASLIRRRSSLATSEFLHQQSPYRMSSRNTWGMPNKLAESEVLYETEASFDTTFLEDKVGLKLHRLYIDPIHSPHRWRNSESFATDLPDYDMTLTLSTSTSRVDTDSDTNLLSVPQDDDDGASTAFATPQGVTPKSSDEEGENRSADTTASPMETSEEKKDLGSEVTGGLLKPPSSLEDSNSYLKSESGSQCTLTDSREGGKADSNYSAGTQVQNTVFKTGQTGRQGSPACPDRSLTPRNGVEDHDGASMSSYGMKPHYPDMPQHLLSINSAGPYGNEIVTFEPQANGQCRTGKATTTENVQSQQLVAGGAELEEGFSVGSGSYNEPQLGLGVAKLGAHQGDKMKHAKDSPLMESRSLAPKFGIGLGSDSPAGVRRSPLSSVKYQLVVNPRGESPSMGSPSPALQLGVGRSPVGSVGTGSTTSDEQPLLTKDAKPDGGGCTVGRPAPGGYPPGDLQLRRQQSSPDVYHTPATSFPPNGTPHFGGPSKHSTLHQQQQQQQQHRFTSPPSYQDDFGHHHQHSPSSHWYGPPPEYQYSPSPLSPSQQSYTSITSLDTVFSQSDGSMYRRPTTVEDGTGQGRLPLVSTVDHIEGQSKFKPGKGIINFCRTTPIVMDLLYCLLQGRPLVLLGKSAEENLIRRLIRVLWLFVPGYSSQRQVITWQDTPLDIRDLSRAKLLGLCSRSTHPIGPHVKPYVSYWDCSSGKLWTPSYNGELLKPIVSRTKDKKNEEVFLTHIHSVLLEIAMKAFVYYHGYCIAMTTTKRSPAFEPSPKKFHHTVSDKAMIKKRKMAFLQKLGVRNSDLDIIEYFVDVIREQQLLEWGQEKSNGGPFDQNPVRIHLHNKKCVDTFCKPKRPY